MYMKIYICICVYSFAIPVPIKAASPEAKPQDVTKTLVPVGAERSCPLLQCVVELLWVPTKFALDQQIHLRSWYCDDTQKPTWFGLYLCLFMYTVGPKKCVKILDPQNWAKLQCWHGDDCVPRQTPPRARKRSPWLRG